MTKPEINIQLPVTRFCFCLSLKDGAYVSSIYTSVSIHKLWQSTGGNDG